MTPTRHPGSLLKELDLSKAQFLALVERARRLKAARAAGTETAELTGRNIALVFEKIRSLHLDELADRHFADGSMGPKIDACARFVTATSRPATVGALADAAGLLAGTAGTILWPSAPPAGSRRVAVGQAVGSSR